MSTKHKRVTDGTRLAHLRDLEQLDTEWQARAQRAEEQLTKLRIEVASFRKQVEDERTARRALEVRQGEHEKIVTDVVAKTWALHEREWHRVRTAWRGLVRYFADKFGLAAREPDEAHES